MRTYSVILLLGITLSCSASTSHVAGKIERTTSTRVENLKRAAMLPWTDDGRCVVREAGNDWPVLVERCFDALDTHRVQFRDSQRRCAVAGVDAATLGRFVGVCLLSQPELIVGAVIVVGVVIVAAEIAAELTEAARCKKVAEQCRETCSETSLPTHDSGFAFWNCLNACLEKNGCPPSAK